MVRREVCFPACSLVVREERAVILHSSVQVTGTWEITWQMVACSSVSCFAAFSPERDNILNVTMLCLLLHKSPGKEFLKAQNKPYEENQEKFSKYDMNSSDNTSLKKSKCVLEEGFVWAFLTTGVSGCLLPRGKARPLPSPLRCFLAVILQVCRCPWFPVTTCFLTAAVGVKVYDGIWKRINIPVIGQGGKLWDLSRANLDNDQWTKWSLYSWLVSTMPSGNLFFHLIVRVSRSPPHPCRG